MDHVSVSADSPWQFRGEVLTYAAPTPKNPKVNTKNMRLVLLDDMQISVGLVGDSFDPETQNADCKAARIPKGFHAFQNGFGSGPCVIGPDIR